MKVPLRYDTEAINKDVPIADLIERYTGIDAHKRGNIICPSPEHTDKNPSAHIYEKTNTCHCFSCQSNFNPISLMIAYNPEMNFPDICKTLIEDFGLSMEQYSNIEEVRRSQMLQEQGKFVDAFPLTEPEMAFIGLEGVKGGKIRNEAYYDARSFTDAAEKYFEAPSMRQFWKEDKQLAEAMILAKCAETISDIKERISEQNRIISKWRNFPTERKHEIQKVYDAVIKYGDSYLTGNIKMSEKQQEGIDTMLEHRMALERIFDYQDDISYVRSIEEKIRTLQAERAKANRHHIKRGQLSREYERV